MTGSIKHRGTVRYVRRGSLSLFAFALLALAPLAAQASEPASGLGQAWPNAPDLSASPRWHVYVFQRDGVRFVQVNDLNGRVLGAFATAGGQYLVLPMGTGATLTAGPADAAPTTGETVYRDDTLQVTATPATDGSLRLRAADTPCTDPVECSTHIAPQ